MSPLQRKIKSRNTAVNTIEKAYKYVNKIKDIINPYKSLLSPKQNRFKKI